LLEPLAAEEPFPPVNCKKSCCSALCLLRRREISGLKFLTQVPEESRGAALLRAGFRAFRMQMMVPMASHCTLLEVLLERRKIRLSRREIAGLKILG
jgi:hypothetical protein